VPRPRFVAPNTLSAVGAVQDYLPRVLAKAGRAVDVIGAHDYDRRLDRWKLLRAAARGRPVWMTEWCQRDEDPSEGLQDSAIRYGEMIHEAVRGGAGAWLAYDWVYPPRKGGESLIHVEWGSDYKLTKIYHLFRQWSLHVPWDSRVLESSATGQLLADAFLAPDAKSLTVHVLNPEAREVELRLRVQPRFGAARAARLRTSATEDCAELEAIAVRGGALIDRLPARSLTTYRLEKGEPGKS
jgi:O-glycosyl hydrolase